MILPHISAIHGLRKNFLESNGKFVYEQLLTTNHIPLYILDVLSIPSVPQRNYKQNKVKESKL